MTPTVGRTVLFTLSEGKEPVNGARTFPAIVTAVHGGPDQLVNLRVFLDTDPNVGAGADDWATSVPRADAPGAPYTWAWPPRLD